MLKKCMVQETKSPVKIFSDSIVRRDLIPVLKGSTKRFYCVMSFLTGKLNKLRILDRQ
jgi:hypothetical protein